MLAVGRIARPHGLRGEVIVDPETDFPAERFRIGNVMYVAAGEGTRPLTIRAVRFQRARPVVGFEGVTTVEEAEGLGRGELRMPLESLGPLPPDTYYHHDLVGCVVVDSSGTPVGRVARIEGGAGAGLLVVQSRGRELLVPLVADFCVEIAPAERRITVALPEGLLDLNA
jgi:16S rRNA processing protein RimM